MRKSVLSWRLEGVSMASSPDLLPDYHDDPSYLVGALKRLATGEVQAPYPFIAKDWRPDAMPLLMWQAACLIEWYKMRKDKGTRYELVPTSGGQYAEIRFTNGKQDEPK
jgi:hypothetical protein